jgi:hypothetical protein
MRSDLDIRFWTSGFGVAEEAGDEFAAAAMVDRDKLKRPPGDAAQHGVSFRAAASAANHQSPIVSPADRPFSTTVVVG